MSYKAAVFDLDGTVLDTFTDIKGSVNRSLSRCGLPLKTDYEIRMMIGMGVDEFIAAAMPPDTPDAKRAEFHRVFAEEYSAHQSDFTAPYAGIREALAVLRENGVKIAVASNKDEQFVVGLCEKHFPGVFDLAIGSRPGLRKKPEPDLVYAALGALGVGKKDAVYIGDSEFDVITAKNAGVDGIAVLWGFRDKKQLWDSGARVFAADAGELTGLILSH